MLVINDEQFIKRAEIIREKGTNRSAFFRGEVDKYNWVDIGLSCPPILSQLSCTRNWKTWIIFSRRKTALELLLRRP